LIIDRKKLGYRLSLVAEQDDALKLKEVRFCLQRSLVDNGGEQAARISFEKFYTAKGLKRLRERVAFFPPR